VHRVVEPRPVAYRRNWTGKCSSVDIPTEDDLPNLQPAALAGRLLAAGTALRGRNLRKRSWLEIAEGLRQTGVARVVLPRLAAAVTREDVIRVLRIVRKHGRRGRPPRGKAGRSRLKGRVATKNEVADEYYDAFWETCGFDDDANNLDFVFFWNRSTFDYRAWQAWDLLIQGTEVPSLSDGLPVSLWKAMRSVACGAPPGAAATAEPDGVERRAVRATGLFDLLRSILRGGSADSTGTKSAGVAGITHGDRQALSVLIIAHSDSGSGRLEVRLEDHTPLIMMLMLSPLWIRRPSTWHAPAAEWRAQVRSLADHLQVPRTARDVPSVGPGRAVEQYCLELEGSHLLHPAGTGIQSAPRRPAVWLAFSQGVRGVSLECASVQRSVERLDCRQQLPYVIARKMGAPH
jgi:hypothetical protein